MTKLNKTVKLNPRNCFVLFLCSLIVAISLSVMVFTGYRMINSMEKEVYADKLEVASVEIQEERIIPVFKEVVVEEVVNPINMKKVGDFYLTAYCPCTICCEKWGGSPVGKTTSIGVGAYQGVTFAVDPKVIPYGSKIYIEGVGVGIATDCGGAIKNKRIDVYFTDHNDANKFGRAGGVAHSVYILE